MVILTVPIFVVIILIFQGKILSTNKIVHVINSKVTETYNEDIKGAKTSKKFVYRRQKLWGNKLYWYQNKIFNTKINSL